MASLRASSLPCVEKIEGGVALLIRVSEVETLATMEAELYCYENLSELVTVGDSVMVVRIRLGSLRGLLVSEEKLYVTNFVRLVEVGYGIWLEVVGEVYFSGLKGLCRAECDLVNTGLDARDRHRVSDRFITVMSRFELANKKTSIITDDSLWTKSAAKRTRFRRFSIMKHKKVKRFRPTIPGFNNTPTGIRIPLSEISQPPSSQQNRNMLPQTRPSCTKHGIHIPPKLLEINNISTNLLSSFSLAVAKQGRENLNPATLIQPGQKSMNPSDTDAHIMLTYDHFNIYNSLNFISPTVHIGESSQTPSNPITCNVFKPTVNIDFESDNESDDDNDSDYDPFLVDESSDDESLEDDDNTPPFSTANQPQANTEEYFDLGDARMECGYCNALMWYQERKDKHKHFANPNKSFQTNLRTYNMMFAFISPGAKLDNKFNNGRGPPMIRIQGQCCHRIGSLLPLDGQRPKFAQLYIYDTENEVSNRMDILRNKDNIDEQIVGKLSEMSYKYNIHAKSFLMARQRLNEGNVHNLKLRLIANRTTDGRVYNQPTVSEVAALIVGDIDTGEEKDIIMQKQGGKLKRIDEFHASYLAFQYPLIFPYGEDGYRPNVAHRDLDIFDDNPRSRLTIREWLAFRIQTRSHEGRTLLSSRRLFQQFLVDGYTMLEGERLKWLRNNQSKLIVSKYNNLNQDGDESQTEGSSTGKRVILPSSYVGSRRFMDQLYYDGMAICSKVGFPDLFITFTCNPNWPEIQRALTPLNMKAHDRPDIIARVF
ncbi:uncharacterized protein LOC131635112 [Vicia villosa]|uniref:uncharacterized protein LOC131635112 n=1 Tax=Vicia villosa TaxID=3911 RepID=UPI00273AF195|nr:uncharacterized protein LOC131635112 [Vicia villosa]